MLLRGIAVISALLSCMMVALCDMTFWLLPGTLDWMPSEQVTISSISQFSMATRAVTILERVPVASFTSGL